MFVHDSFSVSTRSNHQRCSTKKDVLKNFTKFTEKHLCQSLFFNKAAGTPFMNTFYYRIPLVAGCFYSFFISFDTIWSFHLWLNNSFMDFMAYHSMTVYHSFKNDSSHDLAEFFVSDSSSAISFKRKFLSFQRSFLFHNKTPPWWIKLSPRKIPAQKIPTHVFKYPQPRFLIFCLLMSPLSLLLVKFDNRSLL